LPNSPILKTLLAKCTKAVAAIAISIGKNMEITGMSIVPRPNPENSVRPEATNASIDMKIISMVLYL
jgi:hypothetical protein